MIKPFLQVAALVFSASLSVISLAAQPAPAHPVAAVAAPAKPARAVDVPGVNLNTADADTLSNSLVGIGAVKAQAIVAYREVHGPFTSVDQLLEVNGIGAATLDKNRSRLKLD
ncbi:ComEA family DNA-binding protein [Azomonas macrocytogenes]|uniref:Competence protein ComEA n=1 Tax=Azomonas macrocytogenes TaxID=69962 RepID=A0A839T914_AZOMA|nr:helix-hairpin-helix domain-containing protein [Azomonas macrocytogenes]MBB3104133.1 competence protein ComEA [Azomonas macrocytogenes]